jgi:DNA-binding transcriptional ArsR family regulator
LEAAAGAAGPAATEAFKLLGDETRLAILLALWEAHEPFADGDAVGFSTLRDRVGTADSGRFNYHLDRLTDHFVRRTDDGYELREAGLTVGRSVIAVAGFETPTGLRVAIARRGLIRSGPVRSGAGRPGPVQFGPN